VSIKEVNYMFPLYVYPEPGNLWGAKDGHKPKQPQEDRKANLSPDFIAKCSARLGLTWVSNGKGDREHTFGPKDMFDYMYAVFHSPTYRERYADLLKTDFPRLPVPSDVGLFHALCSLGDELVSVHLMDHHLPTATTYSVRGSNLVETVRYTEPDQGAQAGRVWVNATQYVEGVSRDVWEFRIGGYQVCEKWLKDRKGRTLTYDDLDHYSRWFRWWPRQCV
jgi:predicted helicase